MKYKCSNCGAEFSKQVKFCPECGTAQKISKSPAGKIGKEAKTGKASYKMEGRNIIFVVALVSLIIVGFYGYPYITPPRPASSQENTSSKTPTQSQNAFDEQEYQHLKSHVQENPNDFTANVNLGNFLFDNQRFEEALVYYRAAVQINPQAADVLVDAGVSHFNLDQLEKAGEYFERALAVDENHINALYNMGVISARMGSMENMRKYWDRLIKVAPQSQQAQSARQMLSQFSNGGNQ
jgi:cytochrome c-type biogenesis protein CcmH/NrfG